MHPLCPPCPNAPAETPKEFLTASLITPNELFYIRNHLPVPQVDAAAYRLKVEGEGLRAVSGRAAGWVGVWHDVLRAVQIPAC